MNVNRPSWSSNLQPYHVLLLVGLGASPMAASPHAPIDLGPGNTTSGGMNYASAAISLQDGSLLSFHRRGHNGGVGIFASRSTDNGRSWKEPEALTTLTPGRWGGPIPLLDNNQEIHFVIPKARGEGRRPNVDRFIDLYHLRSTHERTRWTEPRRIYEGYCGSIQGLYQLADGRILAPFAHWRPNVATGPPSGPNVCTIVYSDDGGTGWKRSPAALTAPCVEGYNGSNYGACEPSLLQLQDGRVWMLIRTQTGALHESFSPDGAEWFDAAPTRFPSSNSPAFLTRLPDHRIVLFWNNCAMPPRVEGAGVYGGRDALHAAISSDEGRTWRGFREVYRDPTRNASPPKSGDRGTAYPHATVTGDGRILLVSGQGSERRQRFLIDPDWLEERAQSEGFENLDAWHVFKGFGPVSRWWRDRAPGARLIGHPDEPGRNVLQIGKADELPADGAVWNFPAGRDGKITLRLRIGPRFGGAQISVTDRLYEPCDDAGEEQAPLKLPISPTGRLASSHRLKPDRWHELELRWSDIGVCRALLDGKVVKQFGTTRQHRHGFCYLRLRSTARDVDESGLLVESVKALVK